MLKKNNPRHWSNRYWKDNDISKVLKEVIEPDEVDVSSIKFNETLSPLIWSGESLKPDVRNILLKNAKNFIDFCDIENLKFNDIVLVGSMANYNYNEYSDIDIHIILDFNQISENHAFVGEFFKLKKILWSEKLSIQVKGHDVEMYVQNKDETNYSSGTYSIYYDKWINKPIKKVINLDIPNIQLKVANFMNIIDELSKYVDKDNFMERYEKIKNKIKHFRQSGLEKGGEFSNENIAFKILRNSGYIEKLYNLKNEHLSNELSINELLEY